MQRPTRIAILRVIASALALAGLVLPEPAAGHARSLSYSNIALTGDGARVHVRVSLLELSRLGIALPLAPGANVSSGDADAVGDYLSEHLELWAGAERCERVGETRTRSADAGWVQSRWTVHCSGAGPHRLVSRILLAEAPSHLHFARLAHTDPASGRERIVERVLTEAEPEWRLPAEGDASTASAELSASSIADYLVLGVEHIVTGWDHLAFVLALVLLARSLGEVARLVTGFTVAHSITLALAVLGWVEPRSEPVEAVIGFSVALIAAENAWLLSGRGRTIPLAATLGLLGLAGLAALGVGLLPVIALLGLALFTTSHFGLLDRSRDPGVLRVLLAFAFGLVHGFGFAGVLAEMTLPTDRLAAALLGFNAGVEVGQLAVIAAIWPALAVLRRVADGRPHRRLAELGSAAVCGVGLFWFVTRAFGPGGA
ncbi:MAG TPA: HupE/UreJ family protein [Planctomycetota bacterium]|nr:HupE/UreJ family protein [Planctomycetota bacterium]